MCTYLTEKVGVTGSGKGSAGWFTLSEATVYFDHPVHAPAEHTLNIDFLNPGQGPSARVAVELTAESARALAEAIQATLASAPPGLIYQGSAGWAQSGRLPVWWPGLSVCRASIGTGGIRQLRGRRAVTPSGRWQWRKAGHENQGRSGRAG
jgi:hypothetical protein